MNTLRFEVPLEVLAGYRPDAVLGNSVFEVLSELRDLRRLRATLIEVARLLNDFRSHRVVLVLTEPLISPRRLAKEWSSAEALFRPEIASRMAMVIHCEGFPDEVMGTLSKEEKESIPDLIDHARGRTLRPPQRPSGAFFETLRVLMIHWFRDSGPKTAKDLCAQTGFSYPSVAATLKKLTPYLKRYSDRRAELNSFPKEAWFKLVSQSERVRSSTPYADRSGQPRELEVLRARLRELKRTDIAIAGLIGARYHVPGLDLIGNPRLDLVVHSNRTRVPDDFMRRLDPALKPAEKGEAPRVVVHTLYRPESFFRENEHGEYMADEVECLLDLHEMRLEAQALQFVVHKTMRPHP